MKLNGVVLIVIALALAAAYYSGALSTFTARIAELVANPQLAAGDRRLIPFPRAARGNVNARAS